MKQADLVQYLADAGGPIETAPTDGTTVLVWADPLEGLDGFFTLAAYHPDAGWCVDELREAVWWWPIRAPDPHLAAYTKGLEDAARECRDWCATIGFSRGQQEQVMAGAASVLARRIRALSPLPPGSRVVVVPPKGSEAFEALVARMAEAILPEFYGGCSGGELVELGASVAREHARAALRALTGGDDRAD